MKTKGSLDGNAHDYAPDPAMLKELQRQIDTLAKGDFSETACDAAFDGAIGGSLSKLRNRLIETDGRIHDELWVKDKLAQLAMELAGDMALSEVAQRATSFICACLNAGRGVAYIFHADREELERIGVFAEVKGAGAPQRIAYREGLAGQVAYDQHPILLRDYPPESVPITSAVVQAVPRSTYTWPLLADAELCGVMEVALLENMTRTQKYFCDAAGKLVAGRMNAAMRWQVIQDLLDSTRQAHARAEDRAIQLQNANSRLEEQQQQQIVQQNEELQQSNAQLEEQQQQIAQQVEEARQQAENIGQARDELLQRSEELEIANRHKSEFLANMSHELRTPLNSIILLSKMLSRNPTGSLTKDDCKKADVIHVAGEELLRLINDILDLSKIEAGRMAVHVGNVPTATLIRELSDLFIATAQAKDISLTMRDDAEVVCRTDHDKLSQILRNLIANAIKFTHAGGVTVENDCGWFAGRFSC